MIELGEQVRIRAVPTSEVSQQYDGHLGQVMSVPPASRPDWEYDVRLDDGTRISVPREALIRIS